MTDNGGWYEIKTITDESKKVIDLHEIHIFLPLETIEEQMLSDIIKDPFGTYWTRKNRFSTKEELIAHLNEGKVS